MKISSNMPLSKSAHMTPFTLVTPAARNLDGLFQVPGQPLPSQVLADLRTDHAGEVGAVCIYKGVLMFSRDGALRDFAARHLATEQMHLERVKEWLPPAHYSRLLPVWQWAGFLTGALPALFGPRAVYATVEAVETFVDHHYAEQVQTLQSQPELLLLRQTLQECQADEISHRDEAAEARGAFKMGFILRMWCAMVAGGSRHAVVLCRHI
jgi:ubiquinone biosynthesis monooxygenase Coq7